jgi:hypothetical protein
VVATTKSGRVVEALDEVAWMETRPHGLEVLNPVSPLEVIRSGVVVPSWFVAPLLVTTWKTGMFDSDEVAWTVRRANGDEVPIPRDEETEL